MLVIASIAGIIAQTVVYPLDAFRRRMQIGEMAATNVLSDTTWTSFKQVVTTQGYKSLYAGIFPTYMKVIPSVAITMTINKELIQFSRK